MDLQLKLKTAFISGSTQGIGFAIAKQLLMEGAKVIINGRTAEKVSAAVEQLRDELPGADVTGIAADFGDVTQVDRLLSGLPEIDILINNVGIFELKPFAELKDEEWMRIFEVNVMSGVRLSRVLLPKMLERNSGRIIFISSEAGINIPENMIHYGMTKTAMIAVSRGLSQMTKNTSVTVNAILGGPTYSDGVAATVNQIAEAQQISPEQLKAHLMKTLNPGSLLQRFIESPEIANLAVYLSSPLAIATNGAAVRADGGVLQTI
ncbi:3-oxoacyl-[acyl-carrier-protein] reductase [Pedobacter sp. BAL39]|uniref:SDR family NAD(P)-dependent oxidoreductase n=1 Tax=Pedobacter sp. BAL39 TaxID=391596 RepID=UPI0001559887|nr:SDR family oxidoreductase [Pedobacter sp. BAL39]EDM38599.1 3-oxoacyl-[acyl-carrier-protein] reductase [Pedobacter sp. BAL39]